MTKQPNAISDDLFDQDGRLLTISLVAILVGGCGPRFEGCQASRSCAASSSAGESGSATGGLAGSATAGRGSADSGGTTGETGGAGASGGESASAGESGTGGESGDAGNGGAAGAEPCGGECPSANPICHAPTDTCVECTSSTHCDGDTPVCDTTSRTCVECTPSEADACDSATSVCDADTNACVECLENETCTEPTASLCNESHECAPCVDNGDCTHLSGRGVCDAGECVECTPGDETACGGNSCNPVTNRCTTTPRGATATCMPCLADSECLGGDRSDPEQRCVPMHFQGVPREGGFCLRRVTNGCVRPFTIVISDSSRSGAAPEGYCGIEQTLTRCEAVIDLVRARACPDSQDTSCGCARDEDGACSETGAGGICRTVGPLSNQCTHECGGDNDCITGKSCIGLGTTYCQ